MKNVKSCSDAAKYFKRIGLYNITIAIMLMNVWQSSSLIGVTIKGTIVTLFGVLSYLCFVIAERAIQKIGTDAEDQIRILHEIYYPDDK